MINTKTVVELARLGLDGDKGMLVDYLRKLAVVSSNSNKQTLSKELKSLLKTHENELPDNTGGFSTSAFGGNAAQERIVVSYSDIWMPDGLKKRVERFITVHQDPTLPSELKEAYSRILLYGPPGSGKTTLGYYIAERLSISLVYVKVSDVISSRFGETTRNIADIFAQPGRQLIFLDEFDAFGKSRYDNNDVGELKRIVNSLIQTLDFAAHDKIVLGATNIIESIDPAIIRRFNLKINVDKLDSYEVADFFDYLIKSYPDANIKLTKSDKKNIINIFSALGILTVDSIRNVVEHTIINAHLAKEGVIKLEDLSATLLTSGYLDKASIQKIASKDKAIYKLLMESLDSRFNKIDISSYAGVHRNSLTNYNRKVSE